jgi:hypothetical protein
LAGEALKFDRSIICIAPPASDGLGFNLDPEERVEWLRHGHLLKTQKAGPFVARGNDQKDCRRINGVCGTPPQPND